MLKIINISRILSRNSQTYINILRRDVSSKKHKNKRNNISKHIRLSNIREYFDKNSDKEYGGYDQLIYNKYDHDIENQRIKINNMNTRYNDTSGFSKEKMEYITHLRNDECPIVVCTGPTGSGKTYLACLEALFNLDRGNIQKILLTRPAVSIENEQHGFLPGNLESKMDPWLKPIYDNFEDISSPKKLLNLIKSKSIEVCPLAYIRGRTFKNTFIIADEMQNSTKMQFKPLLTRLGDNTKIVITGDFNQSDIITTNDGLNDFIHKLHLFIKMNNEVKYISYVNLTNGDVLRHPAVIEILDIYDNNVI
jgi:phosphate starvation-inducible PhoH-like protein